MINNDNNKIIPQENQIENAKKYYEDKLKNKLKSEGNKINIENISLNTNEQNKISFKRSFSVNPKTNLSKQNSLNNILTNNQNNIQDSNELTFSIMKDYSQLNMNKDEQFLNRMQFDVNKRQYKNERIKKLIEQNKKKIDEVQRIKAFNRLIEDANRRIEAQENLENLKDKLNVNLIAPPIKKYNYEEWENVYKNRFLLFQENSKKKIEKNRKEKLEKKKKMEEDEIKMCKNKKGTKKEIDKISSKLYNDALRRRYNKSEKIKKYNNYIDNQPSKYKKTINSSIFTFKNGDNNKINLSNGTLNQEDKRKKNLSSVEFNNIRFTQSKSQNKTNKKKGKVSKIVIPKYLKEHLKKETKIIKSENYNINDFGMEILPSQQGVLELNAIRRLNNNNNNFKRNYIGYNERDYKTKENYTSGNSESFKIYTNSQAE